MCSHLIRVYTSSGFRSFGARPHFSITPGRKFCRHGKAGRRRRRHDRCQTYSADEAARARRAPLWSVMNPCLDCSRGLIVWSRNNYPEANAPHLNQDV
jgi:hypothetical protein